RSDWATTISRSSWRAGPSCGPWSRPRAAGRNRRPTNGSPEEAGMNTSPRIGDPVNRFDGEAKVTGSARYAAEHFPPGLLYGWIVSSAIARGRVMGIDEAEARALPGVVEVISHHNRR